MAAQSNLKNMALCLTAVCLVCAAILGGVYALTYQPILDASAKALKASIGVVLPEGGEISESKTAVLGGQSFEYYENIQNGELTAYAVKTSANGFGGPILLMVGVLADGTVYNTSVLSHSETPGLGANCSDTKSHFRTQFQGFSGKLAVTKDGGDIDAITASTITSRAYTQAVKQAVDLVSTLNTKEGTENE